MVENDEIVRIVESGGSGGYGIMGIGNVAVLLHW